MCLFPLLAPCDTYISHCVASASAIMSSGTHRAHSQDCLCQRKECASSCLCQVAQSVDIEINEDLSTILAGIRILNIHYSNVHLKFNMAQIHRNITVMQSLSLSPIITHIYLYMCAHTQYPKSRLPGHQEQIL